MKNHERRTIACLCDDLNFVSFKELKEIIANAEQKFDDIKIEPMFIQYETDEPFLIIDLTGVPK